MKMSPSIPSKNYAEQVLLEEAERISQLKNENCETSQLKKTNGIEDVIAKVNLNDEDNFPTLGKGTAKGIFKFQFS